MLCLFNACLPFCFLLCVVILGLNFLMMTTGIDAIAFDVARLHLPIRSLAETRHIEPEKLEKGLGLIRMTFPDTHQDTVVFAANALTKLIAAEAIPLHEIARIYVGTESGIDSSKPIGSFLVSLMEEKFGGSLEHCDTVDFTFACIAGVDALQNCLDFVRLNPGKKAIVITSDIAKYDLASPGEYTQGAGAMAMLVTENPRIIAFGNNWATSTKGVFDFFKPYRTVSKSAIIGENSNPEWFGNLEAEIGIHKDQPVFDGQYSNQCYTDRTRSAYFSFKEKNNIDGTLYTRWKSIIMHLPYSFQGRRMLTDIYASDVPQHQEMAKEDFGAYLKTLSKSGEYLDFVAEKLQPAERASSLIGNLYTGSIFMGFLSTLADFAEKGKGITGETFGFLAYGSGSKSKVFEGIIQEGWKEQVEKTSLFQILEESHEIDFPTYESLHKKERKTNVRMPSQEWVLDRIETESINLIGARYYKWVD